MRAAKDLFAPDTISVHTPTMTLKTAALAALIGTILATVLLVWTFVITVLNVLQGLAPPVMLFPWFVYAFACVSMAVFLYVFHGRSRDRCLPLRLGSNPELYV
jgi:hypothetical protein